MTTLWFDTETYCETPIKAGVHRYAETVEVTVAAWAVDDGPVNVEDLTLQRNHAGYYPAGRPSHTLLHHLETADEIVMHKSDFDRTVVAHAWGIELPVEKVHDTMVRALVHGLPGSLDKLSDLFRLGDDAKDKEGAALIQLFCKPQPKNYNLRRATRETHPVEWAKFLVYAGSDIRSMRALYGKLPRWNYTGDELALWQLDQRINDRGFRADVALAEACVTHAKDVQRDLKQRAQSMTEGYLDSARQRNDVLFYLLQAYGVDLPDLKKDTLERRLEDDRIDEGAKELIRVRLAASTASTAKYGSLMRAVSADGRLRGTTQFCGAKRTGRWSGRLFQPQNLPRPQRSAEEVEQIIAAVKDGNLDLIVCEPMSAMSDALRGLIIATPGRKLYSSDLSNIESVVAAWLADEQWKLDAFEDIFEAKRNGRKVADMYQRSYAASFGITELAAILAIKGDLRQIGKVQELGLGFEGGVGAFLGFAAVYRIDLDKLADAVLPTLSEEVFAKARGMWEWRLKKRLTTYGLTERVFIACEAIKAMWREAHPGFKAYWPLLNAAAVRAVANPGTRVEAGKITFLREKAWLRMILPSGRSLCYPQPQVDDEGKLSYMGENQYTRRWQRIGTYGGKLFENGTQGIARDVMAANMPAIEAAGYEIVMTVHDDVIAEGDLPLTSDHLSSILARRPTWATGMPLHASGFMATRYRKDD